MPSVIFYVYGALAITHLLLQMLFGHIDYRRQMRTNAARPALDVSYSITVVVPVYKEKVNRLRECIESLYNQTYQNLRILVVDDGSPEFDYLNKEVYKRFNHGRLSVTRIPHAGKRHAQRRAFDEATAHTDIVVAVDSDTILHDRNSIAHIVQRFRDPRVGAVTGDVRVENRSNNFLTRLISVRYWMAFNQERAAQSLFGVVMCCSGPFSAYRRSVLLRVEDKYVTQRFLGKPCTFGDDRHLTNLILELGYEAVYDGQARAFTYVPENLREYLTQQLRWNKSFYREILWTLPALRRQRWYLAYDLFMQTIMPFFLITVLSLTILQAVEGHLGVLAIYSGTLFGVALLRCVYCLYRERSPWSLIFIFYGVVHIFLLLPVRIAALMTLRQTQWGTR